MLNDDLRLSDNHRLDSIIKIAVCTGLLAILSPISIDVGQSVPLTLQSMLVVFFPLVFGWLNGGFAVLLYLLIGGIGLPVFANYSGGWELFTGTSGGFLIAFLIAANVVGFFAERNYRLPTMMALGLLVSGQLIILFIGTHWMLGITHEAADWATILNSFLPPLLIKSTAGVVLFVILLRVARRPASRTQDLS